jgi:uncharacterized protein YndB with AHSA1/START domain
MADQEVVLERLLDAPPDRVFRAWLDPAQLKQWWGPRGFTNPVCEVDPTVGGRMRIVMRGPDGTDYPMSATFRAIEPDRRLVFVAVAEDAAGDALLESFTEVLFEAHGDKTRLTVETSAVGLAPVAADMLRGMEEGWSGSLDRLAALINHA